MAYVLLIQPEAPVNCNVLCENLGNVTITDAIFKTLKKKISCFKLVFLRRIKWIYMNAGN